MPRNPAWHDAGIAREVRAHVEGEAVVGHPMAHPDADRPDFIVASATPRQPHPDAAFAALAGDAEPRQRPDHPFLEPPDKLRRRAGMDRRDASLQLRDRLVIRHGRTGDAPLDGADANPPVAGFPLQIHRGCHDIADLLHAPASKQAWAGVRSWRNW